MVLKDQMIAEEFGLVDSPSASLLGWNRDHKNFNFVLHCNLGWLFQSIFDCCNHHFWLPFFIDFYNIKDKLY